MNLEITKNDGTPFKVFTILEKCRASIFKFASSKRLYCKEKTKEKLFLKTVLIQKIFYQKIGTKFEKYWNVSENDSQKVLKDLIENKIKDYGASRILSIESTSKLYIY